MRIVLTGKALDELLRRVERRNISNIDVNKISLDVRSDGVAVKVNEGMWSPTLSNPN